MTPKDLGSAWAREMRVDRGQEWADCQVARAVMQRKLDGMSYAGVQLAEELQKYPLFNGGPGRDVPIVDGKLPPRLARLMEAKHQEEIRQFWDGIRQANTGRLEPAAMDAPRLVGTKEEWRVHRLASDIIKERLDAPERMPRERRQQAALDALYAPEPAPQDARPFSPWGAL